MIRRMRILLVSQMYPSTAAPDFGVFVQGLERELDRQRRRMKDLRIECDGLRDWAEAAEAEISSIKQSVWYRLFARRHD